ncbi:hypothetical protein PAEPH01_1944, partial [Pancytospora epiphaga]
WGDGARIVLQISQYISAIREPQVQVVNNCIVDDAISLNKLVKHSKLLRLNLEVCGLLEDNLKGIEGLEELKELYVEDNFISKGDLNRIFKLKELQVLNMSKSKLFAEKCERKIDISSIKALSKLKILYMDNNGLYEKDIDEIFKLGELRELRMGNYGPSRGKLRNIFNLCKLEKLSIRGNEIDENDMKGITNLKNLRELSVARSKFYGERVFDNIGKLNDSLMLLNVGGCSISENVSIRRIAHLTNLQELLLMNYMPFETLCVILKNLTCLKVLYMGTVNARNFIDCENIPLVTLSRLEILNLSCTCVSNEFVAKLNKLVNLKEFTLMCLKNRNAEKSASLDISVFPSGLRRLKVSGMRFHSLDLHCNRKKDVVEIFENLEELCLSYISDIPEIVMDGLKGCFKLRKLKLRVESLVSFKPEFEGIERIVTLEELTLNEVDLSSQDIMRLSCLKQLRRLELSSCYLNEKYLNEIEKLESLETLDIKDNQISHSMNGVLRLRNLREFSAGVIRFNYEKQGDFELVRGFEMLKCTKWEVYKDDKCINYEYTNFNDVLAGISKEATLNNWKGITELKCRCTEIDAVILLAISPKLVSIESIGLYLDDESKIYEDGMRMLKNCQMLREILLTNFKGKVFLSSMAAINLVHDKPFLQMIDISIDELNIGFVNLLLKCEYLHTLKLRVQKRTDDFFVTLLGNSKKNALRFINVYYSNYERKHRKSEIIFSNIDGRTSREVIKNEFNRKDVSAIIRAGEMNIHVKIWLCAS